MSNIINQNIFNMIKWYNTKYDNLEFGFFGNFTTGVSTPTTIVSNSSTHYLYANLKYENDTRITGESNINTMITNIITTINDKMKMYVKKNNNLKSIDVPNINLKLEAHFNSINDGTKTVIQDDSNLTKNGLFIYNTEIFNNNVKTGAKSQFKSQFQDDKILNVKINVDAMNHYISVPSNLSIKLSYDYPKLLAIDTDAGIKDEFLSIDYRLTYEIQYLINVVPQYDDIKPAVLRFMRKINKLYLRLVLNKENRSLETEWYTDDKYDGSKIFANGLARSSGSHSIGMETL